LISTFWAAAEIVWLCSGIFFFLCGRQNFSDQLFYNFSVNVTMSSSSNSVPIIFQVGASSNFPLVEQRFLDSVMVFGVPGRELIEGKRAVAVPFPKDDDADEAGNRKYSLASYRSKDGDLMLEAFLSDIGDRRLFADQQEHKVDAKLNQKHSIALLAHTLSMCSPASIQVLVALGPKYAEAKLDGDTFTIWEMIRNTHLHGSGRTKLRHLSEWLATKQTTSHEAYMGEIRQRGRLVLSAFGSDTHEGFIAYDSLLRALYLNGLDQAAFQRPLDEIYDKKNLSSDQVMELCQEYYLDRGSEPSTFAGKALVASTVKGPNVPFRDRPDLGVYDPSAHSKFCAHCWRFRFKAEHSQITCSYFLKSVKTARKVAAQAERLGIKALAASVPDISSPVVPTVVAPIPLSSGVSDAVSDHDVVSKYEKRVADEQHASYLAARNRLDTMSKQPYGLVCDGADMKLILDFETQHRNMESSFLPSAFHVSEACLRWWYDNCASVSIVNRLAALCQYELLKRPFQIGGVKGGITLTHVGYLSFLPKSIGLAYFSAESDVNLISLGFIQSQGGSYRSVGSDQVEVSDPSGEVVDLATVGVNRLPAVSSHLYSGVPDMACAVVTAVMPIICPDLTIHHSDAVDKYVLSLMTQDSVISMSHSTRRRLCPARLEHFNAEQRARCDRAEALHQKYHFHDDLLCEGLSAGADAEWHVTAADVRLNRRLRGKCPQCLEGKLKAKPMAASMSAPADAPGVTIVTDCHALAVKSKGGNLDSIRSIDEFSGDLQVTPIKSKHAAHLFDGFMDLVYRRYNKYGFKVHVIMSDAEPALEPVIKMLAMMGIILILVAPGHHAQRMEIHTLHLDGRKRAILAGLHYYLPTLFDVYLDCWISDSANSYPNSRSRPSTADIIIVGQRRRPHHKHPELCFGQVCLVSMFKDKRSKNASVLGTQHQQVPKSELGVCLGYSREIVDTFSFLLANGEIVPREVFEIVQIVPFGWTPRSVLRSELRPPGVYPEELPQGPIQGVVPMSAKQPNDMAPPREPVSVIDTTPVHNVPSQVVPPALPADEMRQLIREHMGIQSPAPVAQPTNVASDMLPSNDILSPLSTVDTSLAPDVESPTYCDTPSPVQRRPHSPAPYTVVTRSSRRAASGSVPMVTRSAAREGKSYYCPIYLEDVGTPELSEAELAYVYAAVATNSSAVRLAATSGSLPSSCSDPLTADETAYLDNIIAMNQAYVSCQPSYVPPVEAPSTCAAVDYSYLAESFDTRMSDELPLDEYLALMASNECLSDRHVIYKAFVACTASLSEFDVAIVAVAERFSSSNVIPIPSTKCKEVTLRAAVKNADPVRLRKSTEVEINKNVSIGAYGEFMLEAQVPSDALIVDAHVLYKLKADGRETCRIAVMGNRLEKKPTAQTFASVVSDGAKMFSLAAMQAHCELRNDDLIITDLDVVGGFLHIELNSPVPMFLRLPKNLPHPMAGRCVEIKRAIYGLQESNRLFALEMARVIIEDAGFSRTSVEAEQFVKFADGDMNCKCIVSVTVDDNLAVANDQSLVDDLSKALTERFGPLTTNVESKVHTGLEFTRYDNGALLVTQDASIARAASVVGVSHFSPVSFPVHDDFFQSLDAGAESDPVDSTVYSSLTGMLVQFLKTRHDVRLFISYLCSYNSSPCEGHYSRALHVLRYLYSTPGQGCVFKSCGGVLFSSSDAAHGLFLNGKSSTAFYLSIGEHNAPFVCSAKSQPTVATCPMTAEYYAAGSTCSEIIHYRQLSSDLGWPTSFPTDLAVDNKTAMNLANAPEVSRKSRHIFIKHHWIRELVANGLIRLVYVSTKLMRANLLTKYLPPRPFIFQRDNLFNRSALPSK
jgi:hypothetical protein